MRLTLRTLLAYMDDILDPADHEELGKKIESSDFATELIHRSRDTVRRLRLSAPDVLVSQTDVAGNNGFDANQVAEYLDNTMAAEHVADFERLCLESDMHLAEVASCHHVLTMVLGEPVEVNETVRKRIYTLPENLANNQQLRIEPSHQDFQPQTADRTADSQPAAAVMTPQGAVVEIPDYLQAAAKSKRRIRRWLVAAVLLISSVGYFAYLESIEPELPPELAGKDKELLASGLVISRPGENSSPTEPVRSTEQDDPNSEAPPFVIDDTTPDTTDAPALNRGNSEEAPPFVPQGLETVDDSSPDTLPGGPDASSPNIVTESIPADDQQGPLVVDVPEFEMLVPSREEGEPTSPGATDQTVVTDQTARVKRTLPAALPIIPDSTETEQADDSEMEAEGLVADDGEPVRIALADQDVGVTIDVDEAEEAVTESAEKLPVRIGNYLGTDDVLLRMDTKRNSWVRVAPRSELSTGERLLGLPKFRSPVVIAGLNVSLSGGTQIVLPLEMAEIDAGILNESSIDNGSADFTMEIVFGRVLLNAGLDGSDLMIVIDDQIRELRLGDSASLAVEVDRKYVPGSNAEEVSAPIAATWYLSSGSLQWISEKVEQTIDAPAMWRMTDQVDQLPKRIEELPAWIDREPVSATEHLAQIVLDDELTPGEPVEIRLLELNDPQHRGRRQEVRALAAQCSVYVGEFEPFVKALSDVQQKATWTTHIDTLRQAMVLSPDVANNLRDAFVRLRGEAAADDLMQLVKGYDARSIGTTPEEVRNGPISQLIRWLDNDSLDYRVLAYHNLHEITGKSIGGYRPTYNSNQRQRAIRSWQSRLESGELLPKP